MTENEERKAANIIRAKPITIEAGVVPPNRPVAPHSPVNEIKPKPTQKGK